MARYKGRLELTWTNKHERMLAHEDGSYEWLLPADYRVAEVRLLHDLETVGSVGRWRAGDNLLIQGDALHALTSLTKLPEFSREYVGKVKLAYIDPPFNTGQAFEHYDDALEHSVWLTMLRDRLLQIQSLLSPNGSVWVHLDDEEVHRCRLLLDEVFQPENFIGCAIWQKADSGRNDAKGLSTDQDYILVYAKDKELWRPNRTARTAKMNAIYASPDRDAMPWFDDNPTAPGAKTHQGMVYAIQSPFTGKLQYPARGRCWFADQGRMLAALNEWAPYERRDIEDVAERASRCGVDERDVRPGVKALMLAEPVQDARAAAQERYEQGVWPELIFRSGGEGGIGRKRYQPDTGAAPRTLWLNTEVGHNRTAKAEIKALFPIEVPFSTPKPEKLLQKVLQIASGPGDIVLDCFAGSGTTAAVAQKLGRRWVTVERSAGIVARFTKPRLQRVVDGKDFGGITVVEVPSGDGPPDGVRAGEARAAAKVLVALQDAGTLEDSEDLRAIIRALRAVDKTTSKTIWAGGGGFRVLAVAPSMFESEGGLVYLADWMTKGKLAEATAAQLGYEYRPEPPFAGRKGRTRLAVIDGVVNEGVLRILVSALDLDETIVVCGTGIDPEARPVLRELRRGSTLRKIPAALLDRYRAPRQRATPIEESTPTEGGTD